MTAFPSRIETGRVLSSMEFTVYVPDPELSNGSARVFEGDIVGFRVENGALIVDQQDGSRITFGPLGWLRVWESPAE